MLTSSFSKVSLQCLSCNTKRKLERVNFRRDFWDLLLGTGQTNWPIEAELCVYSNNTKVFAKDNSAGNCFKLVSSSLIFSMFTCCFFFAEMVDDWTMNYRPDLLTFVPYEWSFNIILRDFEMVWLGNQHNWSECASNRQENGMFQTC